MAKLITTLGRLWEVLSEDAWSAFCRAVDIDPGAFDRDQKVAVDEAELRRFGLKWLPSVDLVSVLHARDELGLYGDMGRVHDALRRRFHDAGPEGGIGWQVLIEAVLDRNPDSAGLDHVDTTGRLQVHAALPAAEDTVQVLRIAFEDDGRYRLEALAGHDEAGPAIRLDSAAEVIDAVDLVVRELMPRLRASSGRGERDREQAARLSEAELEFVKGEMEARRRLPG